MLWMNLIKLTESGLVLNFGAYRFYSLSNFGTDLMLWMNLFKLMESGLVLNFGAEILLSE